MPSAAAEAKITAWIFPTASSSRAITSRWPEAQSRLSSAPSTTGAAAILLDHVSVEHVRQAVDICSRHSRRIPLECGGGITLENVRAYAETGVDFISVGALTQSATAVDMSLRVSPA